MVGDLDIPNLWHWKSLACWNGAHVQEATFSWTCGAFEVCLQDQARSYREGGICWLDRKASLTGECAAYWRVNALLLYCVTGGTYSDSYYIKLYKGVAGDVDTYC